MDIKMVCATLFASLWLFFSGITLADYAEECQSEGCNNEEVSELYNSYAEECINEGCSNEEVIELAGNPNSVNSMLSDFNTRGWRTLMPGDSGTDAARCQALGSTTSCAIILMFCQDWYQCPTGSDTCEGKFGCPGGNTSSAPYVCGVCIGFDW